MKVGIIGGGASGVMGAVSAAKCGHNVTILEKNTEILKKVLSTGNGRCNFTNANVSSLNYNKEARSLFDAVYSRFDNTSLISFFNEIGICPCEKNGYYYPRSMQALSVAGCLQNELKRLNVNIIRECNVLSVKKVGFGKDIYNDSLSSGKKFIIETDKGDFEFDKIIISTGSLASLKVKTDKGYKDHKGDKERKECREYKEHKEKDRKERDFSGYDIAESLGHTLVKPLPALCALKCTGFDFKSVAGVRCMATVTLIADGKNIKSDTGELQLTDYGISGIPVFQISSDAVRLFDKGLNVRIKIDFMPDFTEDELNGALIKRLSQFADYKAPLFLDGMINSKLSEALVCSCMSIENNGLNIKKNKKQKNMKVSGYFDNEYKSLSELCVSDNDIKRLAKMLKNTLVTMNGFNDFKNAQVCSGGVISSEISDTLESKLVKDLYFAGEIIDIDGECGGYNLQWAFSSGYVAGCFQ